MGDKDVLQNLSDLVSGMNTMNTNLGTSIAGVIKSLLPLYGGSVLDPNAYTTCCCSFDDSEHNRFRCNNPFGDGSDPTYVCKHFSDGVCSYSGKCEEKYSTEEI